MKILLTIDLNHPDSPERASGENLLRLIWDQLQVTGLSLEMLSEPPQPRTLPLWAKATSSITKYRDGTPSPLESYNLIIGVNLPAGAEALFTSLGLRTLILRTVPCPGFNRFVLVRANFQLPQEFCTQFPVLKNLCHQDYPSTNIPSDQRNWWLSHRFLLNHGTKDSSILFLGTTLFQPERIRSGSLVNLMTYEEKIMPLLRSCPNFYYASGCPVDPSELRFMKSLGACAPAMELTHLLARDEFDFLVSIDSGFVPVAAAFNKKITILGSHPTWTPLQIRRFCDRDFILALLQPTLFV